MSALIDSVSDFSTILIDTPAPKAAPAPHEPGVVELATEIWAPVRRFGSSHVEVAEEVAFRALFLAAAVVTFYGIVSAF